MTAEVKGKKVVNVAAGTLPVRKVKSNKKMAALPTEFSGYAHARRQLRRAGASRGVARAIAWSGGIVALVGMFGVFALLFELFYPS